MSIRRITFFVHDLAANPIVRAAALAAAVRRRYDVEIIGFLHSGPDVYEPYRGLFTCKTIHAPLDVWPVAKAIPALAALATGDVIYACKPLVTTLGPALYAARHLAARPLLLDVEDDEWATPRSGWPSFLWRDVVKGWRHATAWKFTRMLHPLTALADAVTVSTRRLQQRYGGVIVRHGPAGTGFDPDRPDLQDTAALRRLWNLPDRPPLVLFAGVPQPHKGWPILLEALAHPVARQWHLVLAGAPDHHEFAAAARVLRERCHIVGVLPHEAMPLLLAAVNAVPVPQFDVRFAQSQLPAKLVEAMAMARPVIASRVGDLPEIIGANERGWLVPPGDPAALAAAFDEIARVPELARSRGRAARSWYLAEASQQVIESRVLAIVEAVARPTVGLPATEAL